MAMALVHIFRPTPSQAAEGIMVVESFYPLGVVEALDIEARLAVVVSPVDMLEHVQVGWDI